MSTINKELSIGIGRSLMSGDESMRGIAKTILAGAIRILKNEAAAVNPPTNIITMIDGIPIYREDFQDPEMFVDILRRRVQAMYKGEASSATSTATSTEPSKRRKLTL